MASAANGLTLIDIRTEQVVERLTTSYAEPSRISTALTCSINYLRETVKHLRCKGCGSSMAALNDAAAIAHCSKHIELRVDLLFGWIGQINRWYTKKFRYRFELLVCSVDPHPGAPLL